VLTKEQIENQLKQDSDWTPADEDPDQVWDWYGEAVFKLSEEEAEDNGDEGSEGDSEEEDDEFPDFDWEDDDDL
jgi:hypothetical protein